MSKYNPTQIEIETLQNLRSKHGETIKEISGWIETCFEHNFYTYDIAKIDTAQGPCTVYNAMEIIHCMPDTNGFKFDVSPKIYFQTANGNWFTNDMKPLTKDEIIQQLIDFRLDEETALNPIERKIIDAVEIRSFMDFYSNVLRTFTNVAHVDFDMLHFDASSRQILDSQFGVTAKLVGKIIPLPIDTANWLAEKFDFSSIHHPIKCLWLRIQLKDGIVFTLSTAGPGILHICKSYVDDDTCINDNIYPIDIARQIAQTPHGFEKLFPKVEYSLPMVEHQSNLNIEDTKTYLKIIKRIEKRYGIKFTFTPRQVTPLAFLSSLDSTTPLTKEYAELSAYNWSNATSTITVFLNGWSEPNLHIKIKELGKAVIYKSYDIEDVSNWAGELDRFFKLKISDCGKDSKR